ncbi:benzoate/H(+) symporter BenE family transporter [Paenalcaligenes hominis]|uniref:benzoate/H(+) symporter BenE family transporter n=1 Tax=Paenalcaligenes hominis TaxID=643674 RepID=UPI003524561E
MKPSLSFPSFSAGFLAVLVGYTSSIAIVLQAAQSAGASATQLNSAMLVLGVGVGAGTILLSLLTRVPILLAWSTPGAALLATSLHQYSYAEAIGIFIFASALMVLVGVSGLFHRFSRWIPPHLAAAMLAGILVHFGIALFNVDKSAQLLVGVMLLAYLIVRWVWPRLAIIATLTAGILFLSIQGAWHSEAISWHWAVPAWQSPVWNSSALLGVGLPLFLVTLSSQNLPGVAMIQSFGYQPRLSPIITATGLLGVVLAPFGGFAYNLAAISAALCLSPEADPNPQQRYKAAVFAGGLYILCGLLGATIIGIFYVLPAPFITALAGIALISTLSQSFASAFEKESQRESTLFTFLVTASGLSFFNVGSAFWGLVLGLLIHYARPRTSA